MKHQTKRFKSSVHCLKELKPFILDGKHLETGTPFKNFGGMRSREVLANWLMCVTINSMHSPERLTFTSDPTGGDGIVVDTMTGRAWCTEHVCVPTHQSGNATTDDLILKAIAQKQSKGGRAYASGKTLVVFLNSQGELWYPNRIATKLAELLFDAVWVVALQTVEDGQYTYAVTRLDLRLGNAPTWRVHISKEFDDWRVETVQ